MYDLIADRTGITFEEVFLDFPVESGFKSIFHTQSAAGNHKQMRQIVRNRYFGEGIDERRHFYRI